MISACVHFGASESCRTGGLAGMSTVHGLSLRTIMQQRCGDWVISLNGLPGKARGPLLGPGVNQRKLHPPPPSPPFQFPAQIKKHWWHHRLPSLKKKKKKRSQWSSLITMCSGRHNNVFFPPLPLQTFQVETAKPQAAVKLNNSQGQDGGSITIRGSLSSLRSTPENWQTRICARDVQEFHAGVHRAERSRAKLSDWGARSHDARA